MSRLLAGLCVFYLIAASSTAVQQQGSLRKVEGVLLISTDRKVVSKANQNWTSGEEYAVFVKRFAVDRFYVKPWGKRSAIVIDLQSGPLGFLALRSHAANAVLQKVGANGVVNIQDLSREQIHGLYLNGGTAPDGSESEGALGLSVTVNFSVKQGKSTKFLPVGIHNQTTDERDRALQQHALTVRPTNGRGAAAFDKPIAGSQDEMGAHFLGVAVRNFAEGMTEASKAIVELDRKYRDELARAGTNLIKKLGLTGPPLPDGEVSLNDVPQSLRNNLSNVFGSSWSALGFANQSSATAFLQSCDSVQMSTSLGFIFSINPHASGNIVFATIPGGIAP